MTKTMKIKIIVIILILIVFGALIAVFSLKSPGVDGPGIAGGFEDGEEQIMLVDYYRATVATVGGDGYSETVLYRNSDGSCEVHYYSKYEGDAEEAHTAYAVDPGVLEEVFKIIRENKIASWNDKKYAAGLDGARYVLKFRDSKGEYIRVSSDNMPEDGVSVMNAVNACMSSYVNEDSKPLQ